MCLEKNANGQVYPCLDDSFWIFAKSDQSASMSECATDSILSSCGAGFGSLELPASDHSLPVSNFVVTLFYTATCHWKPVWMTVFYSPNRLKPPVKGKRIMRVIQTGHPSDSVFFVKASCKLHTTRLGAPHAKRHGPAATTQQRQFVV